MTLSWCAAGGPGCIELELLLHQRPAVPGCNLTYGLPQVLAAIRCSS